MSKSASPFNYRNNIDQLIYDELQFRSTFYVTWRYFSLPSRIPLHSNSSTSSAAYIKAASNHFWKGLYFVDRHNKTNW